MGLFVEKSKSFLRGLKLNATWSTSLEPMVFLAWAAYNIVSGSQIDTDLLIRKMCEERYELKSIGSDLGFCLGVLIYAVPSFGRKIQIMISSTFRLK